jgi:hypothetical protein
VQLRGCETDVRALADQFGGQRQREIGRKLQLVDADRGRRNGTGLALKQDVECGALMRHRLR